MMICKLVVILRVHKGIIPKLNSDIDSLLSQITALHQKAQKGEL